MRFEEKDLPFMNRQEVHEKAQLKMMEPGPIGEAWAYIYELTGPAHADKSKSWIRTMLNRAANDPNIAETKRQLCFDTSCQLD